MIKKIFSFSTILLFSLIISITSFVWGYRINSPASFTDLTNPEQLSKLNIFLNDIWNITNGRYSPDKSASASTGTGTVKMGSASSSNSSGFIKFILTDGTSVYVPYWLDDTP